jgi:phospholipid/cholesterol/gamma-HCH transport system substrate-binding protein
MKTVTNNNVIKILIILFWLGLGHASGKFDLMTVLSGDAYSIYAQFNSVAGLKIGHPVKMLGLKIGRVAGFKMDQENQMALAKLKIKDGIKIYDDAFASIKMESLIGENYVSIDPGGSGDIMQTGETITETESLIDIGELISKYAFGDVVQYRERKVRLALKKNRAERHWVD